MGRSWEMRVGILLWLLMAGGVAQAAAQPNPPVWLTAANDPTQKAQGGLLGRELYRQAFLIAARDELGLQTRDESLREWRGTPPAAETYLTAFLENQITIKDVGTSAVLWRRPLGEHWCRQLVKTLAEAEELSRTVFVAALRTDGRAGKPNAVRADAPEPEGVEGLLGQMDELSQFSAVQVVYSAIRREGESEERLGALVRGYANLGQLTRYHWAFDFDVFAARSLLYAQRMVERDPKSAFALWHRAYAFALAGLHAAALDDLASAEALRGDTVAPRWVALLEPFCRYQTTLLASLSSDDKTRRALGSYLAYLSTEYCGSQAVAMKYATAALTVNPNCMRLIDAMCEQTGPGPLNDLTDMGPAVYGQFLGHRLALTAGLPRSVVDLIQRLKRGQANPSGREIVCQGLIDAGDVSRDANEPSWAALGRMIQETTFAHVERKANLIAYQWGSDASSYVAEARPLIADHPFRNFIEAYGLMRGSDPQPLRDELKTLPRGLMVFSEMHIHWMEQTYQSSGTNTSGLVFQAITDNCDVTAGDLNHILTLFQKTNEYVEDMSNCLGRVSPYAPQHMVWQIRDHWDAAMGKTYEAEHGGFPAVSFALGTKYAELKQWPDAERCLKRYIETSPDYAGYEAVAQVYLAQNEEDLWLATLEQYLQQPDFGLQHSVAEEEIANHFMERGEYDQALPFADDAGSTASAAGLECQAAAHAGTGDWEGAEKIIRDEEEHYGMSPYPWFCWCVRTGHGDRADAAIALRTYLRARGEQTNDDDRLQGICLYLTQNKAAEADFILQERMKLGPGPVSGLHIALLADARGDAAARDRALDEGIAHGDGNKPVRDFAKVLKAAYAAGADAIPDAAAVVQTAKAAEPTFRVFIYYCMACYLDQHHHADEATGYLKKCMGVVPAGKRDAWSVVMVDAALRDRGLDPLALEREARAPGEVSLYP